MKLLDAGPRAVEQFWAAHAHSESIGLRTAGTTSGRARVVRRSTQSWVGSFGALAAWVGLTPADRCWIPGPMAATMNLFAACLSEWAGANWSTDPRDATVTQLTPARLAQLTADRRRVGPDARPPMTVIVAGDALSRSLRDDAAGTGLRVLHYYGAAELSMVAVGSHGGDLTLFDRVEARTDDGRLWVRSPWLSSGYAVPGERPPLIIDEDGFFTVGDHARLDGRRLTVLGRDGFITSAGETVPLAPIRAQLQEHCRGDIHLIGLPGGSLGDVLTCVVPCEEDIAPLRAWARAHLHGAARPRRWVAVAEPPLTAAGKIDHRALVGIAAQRAGAHA